MGQRGEARTRTFGRWTVCEAVGDVQESTSSGELKKGRLFVIRVRDDCPGSCAWALPHGPGGCQFHSWSRFWAQSPMWSVWERADCCFTLI